jgi:hypothetical protein
LISQKETGWTESRTKTNTITMNTEEKILKLHQEAFESILEQEETLEIGGIEYVHIESFKETIGIIISAQIAIQLMIKSEPMSERVSAGLFKVVKLLQGESLTEDPEEEA